MSEAKKLVVRIVYNQQVNKIELTICYRGELIFNKLIKVLYRTFGDSSKCINFVKHSYKYL